MIDLCPCGSQTDYTSCCSDFHHLKAKATSAEQLMRSRFSAFYYLQKDTDIYTHYLLQTWKPNHPIHIEKERKQLILSASKQQWKSLKILHSSEKGQQGSVEFIAFFTTTNPNKAEQLHEHSHFIYDNGAWFYQHGDMLDDVKLGRNDHCWCGSGKKLKKCHVD